MMEAIIPSQVEMSLRTLQKKRPNESQTKKEPNEPKQKNGRKERRDNATILLPHLCFKVAP